MQAEEFEATLRRNSQSGLVRAERAHALADRAARRAQHEWDLARAEDSNALFHIEMARLHERARDLHQRAAALQDHHAVDEAKRADAVHQRSRG